MRIFSSSLTNDVKISLHCCVVTEIKLSIVLHWSSLPKSIKISINVDFFFRLVSDHYSRAIHFSLFLITQVLSFVLARFLTNVNATKERSVKKTYLNQMMVCIELSYLDDGVDIL